MGQIVESQARGAIAQAPPKEKNTESPGERGLAEEEAEKEEQIVPLRLFGRIGQFHMPRPETVVVFGDKLQELCFVLDEKLYDFKRQ